MAHQQKVVCDLLNGAIFNYLEPPYPQFPFFDAEYPING